MKVRVLFFGASADAVGKRETSLEVEGSASVAAVTDLIINSNPDLRECKLLFAINEEYVDSRQSISDGDELAIFTPVSGG